MPHTNKPIQVNATLRPSIDSTFVVPVYTDKAIATKQCDEEASKYRETRYTVKIDDGYVSVNHSGYFALFGDLPCDDVVYRGEP